MKGKFFMESFSKKINELNTGNIYPFHMPGHKRRMELPNPYSIDITEIDGYDNLHNPEGMIKGLEERISRLYNTEDDIEAGESYVGRSYVLVNGSTCGILSAISAVTRYGDSILMARNSHKSAYNAVCVRGLRADYIYPEYIKEIGMNSVILPENVRNMLYAVGYPAVYITSPTYEGIVSNIREISDIVHGYGAVLIVDEAHGAHFGLGEGFPDSAIKNGADIVIQSIHKTLMGMTQTAVLHVSEAAMKTGRVDIEKLEYYLRVYQTSSPSYVLMSSVDECIRMLENKEKRKRLFVEYKEKLDTIHKNSMMWKDIHIFAPEEMDAVDKKGIFDFDRGKLVIYSRSGRLTGKEIYDILREKYGLQLEMSLGRYCLAMTSCMDSSEGFERLASALEELDRAASDKEMVLRKSVWTQGQQCLRSTFTIAQAFDMEKSTAELKEGAVSGEYVYVYPPGIPFIVPGEIVTKEVICDIIKAKASGYEVHGVTFEGDTPYMKVLE